MMGKIFVFTTLALAMLSGTLAIDPTFRNPPSDTVGVAGNDVTMYCQVAHKGKNNPYWHCLSDDGEQDFTIGPNENTNHALSRFTIDNSGANLGQYNLIIANATEFDSGMCSCILETGKGNAMEAKARLTIVRDQATNPKDPTCSIDKQNTPGQQKRVFTAEDDIQLICQSRDGVPLADIHWEIVRVSSNGVGVELVSSISTTEDSITAIVDYSIKPADNGAYFQCVQTQAALSEPSTCSPLFQNNRGKVSAIGSPDNPITVIYPPVLRFIPHTLKVTPFETREETLRCAYEANPELDSGPTIRYDAVENGDTLKWNYTTPGEEDSVDLTLEQSDHGKIIECVATNELGTSVIMLKIDSTGLLPSWITLAIIGGGGLIMFMLVAMICCVFFCGGSDHDHDKEGSQEEIMRSRQDSLDIEENIYGHGDPRPEDGDADPEMINIDEFMFEGGEMKKDIIAGYIDSDEDELLPATSLKKKRSTHKYAEVKKESTRKYDEVPIE